MKFIEYLQKKRLEPRTIKGYNYNLQNFKKWLKTENLRVKSVTYNDVTAYTNHLQNKKLSPATINIKLRTIERYYDYLKRNPNPAKDLRIKGTKKRALPEILTPEQLEQIYHSYINKPKEKFKGRRSNLVHNRNLVVLSLLIYQGLHAGEISKLEVSHINLIKGTIYIPSGNMHNSRTLKLQAMQQIVIQNYLQHIRTEILQNIEIDKLFDFKRNAHGIVSWLIKDLKKLSPLVKSAKQIRVSVIMNWLKNYNIRQVQYMIGHNNISSTQTYKIKSIDNLQEQLIKYHPLK